MLIPLPWLKEFVDIKLPIKDLAWKLSEAGLTVEKWEEKDGDVILEPEITPNRPDWMCVYGIAREISAITNKSLVPPDHSPKPSGSNHKTTKFEITTKNNFDLCPRYTAVIVKNIKVRPSPDWIQKRLKQVGLRPINNLVDITNFVMWEHGNPLHVFDLDKIRGKQMVLEEARGGESFRSLDGIDYHLPKGAIVIKDVGRIIDLCGIKGGENTSVSAETKNILIHVPIYDPAHIRRTSQALGLRSDASAIFERGANPGGTIGTLNRAVSLILELAGGEVGSEILDLKEKDFQPWKVLLSHEKLEKVLGIPIETKKVVEILQRLGLYTTYKSNATNTTYSVNIPTFRNDLHIEEDLIEEVARISGYNSFPKTLPQGALPTTSVAYAKNYSFEFAVKEILKGAGYTEIYTYSLISESQLIKLAINPGKTLRIDNPISRDFEYLRPFLLGNLLEACKLNLANFSHVKLFELGKVYKGDSLDKFNEPYFLSAVITGQAFFEAKGTVELLLTELGIKANFTPDGAEKVIGSHPGRRSLIMSDKEILGFIGEVHPTMLTKFGIKSHVTGFFLNFDVLEKIANPAKKYQPVPKYPPVIEDISLVAPDKVLYGEIVDAIKSTSKLVRDVGLIDVHGDSKTLRLTYQDLDKNLTDSDAAEIRTKILKNLKEKLAVKPKND